MHYILDINTIALIYQITIVLNKNDESKILKIKRSNRIEKITEYKKRSILKSFTGLKYASIFLYLNYISVFFFRPYRDKLIPKFITR